MMLTYSKIHERALEIWAEREKSMPERVRRMKPDDLDRASGVFGHVVEQAARELGWQPGDEIKG